MNSRETLNLVPFSLSTKNTLLDLINTVSHPILGDWSVIIMMAMLFIFGAHGYSTGDSTVQSINKQLWTMLRRHLTNTMSCQASVVDGMAHIQHCLHALPTMLTLNKDVLNKFVWINKYIIVVDVIIVNVIINTVNATDMVELKNYLLLKFLLSIIVKNIVLATNTIPIRQISTDFQNDALSLYIGLSPGLAICCCKILSLPPISSQSYLPSYPNSLHTSKQT